MLDETWSSEEHHLCLDLLSEFLCCIAFLLASSALRRASLVAQLVKNPPAMQETQVQFLGGGDPQEEGMAPHSSIAWRIPWTEEPGRLKSVASH